MISNNVIDVAIYILDKTDHCSVTIYTDLAVQIGNNRSFDHITDILPIVDIEFISEWEDDAIAYLVRRSPEGRTGAFVIDDIGNTTYYLISA